MTGSIEAVRGMRDVLPEEYGRQALLAARLERLLASHGYAPFDAPIIERRDLYLRKLGEELVGKVYEFSFSGRELALRPEWTASVLRAYVSRMQDQPLPLRLRYAGPVFRNERPQRGTYRQFTQIGVELLGAPAPRADAEALALACAGLDAVGVRGYRVTVGHIGLVRAALMRMGLAERTQETLLWSMRQIREQGAALLAERLLAEDDAPVFDAALIAGLPDAQAEAILRRSLEAIGVNLRFGTRPADAIVARLVRKLRRTDTRPALERALALLERLVGLTGPADAVLPAAEALLAEYGVPADALQELRALLALLPAHGVDPAAVRLDLGLGRGLHYYTGPLWEIDAADGAQLCGGGRYDDLVQVLGGRQRTPAVGFAYGLERVVAAAEPAPAAQPQEALVVAADDAAYERALAVARTLRARGWAASVDLRGGLSAKEAARRGAAALALVAADGPVAWRDLATRAERLVTLDDLPEAMGVRHGY